MTRTSIAILAALLMLAPATTRAAWVSDLLKPITNVANREDAAKIGRDAAIVFAEVTDSRTTSYSVAIDCNRPSFSSDEGGRARRYVQDETALVTELLRHLDENPVTSDAKPESVIGIATMLVELNRPWGLCTETGVTDTLKMVLYSRYQQMRRVVPPDQAAALIDRALMNGHGLYIEAVYLERPCGDRAAWIRVRDNLRTVSRDYDTSGYSLKALFQRGLLVQEQHLCDGAITHGSIQIRAPTDKRDNSKISIVAQLLLKSLTDAADSNFRNDIRYLVWLNSVVGVARYHYGTELLDEIISDDSDPEIWVEAHLRHGFTGSGVEPRFRGSTAVRKAAPAKQLARYAKCVVDEEKPGTLDDFGKQLEKFTNRNFRIVMSSWGTGEESRKQKDALTKWLSSHNHAISEACKTQIASDAEERKCVARQLDLNDVDATCNSPQPKIVEPAETKKRGGWSLGGRWSYRQAETVLSYVRQAGYRHAYIDIDRSDSSR